MVRGGALRENRKALPATSFSVGLAGCSPTAGPPLLFGQTHTLGVAIHGSATQQGVDLTLGYRDFNLAIVPVTATDASGQIVQIRSSAGPGHGNALSVLGQFESNANCRHGDPGGARQVLRHGAGRRQACRRLQSTLEAVTVRTR
jgi:hypothetical protein